MTSQAHTANSLIFVIKQTLPKVRSLSGRLETAPAREKASILRQLERSASTLSAAVTRLSAFSDHIEPDPESKNVAPQGMPPAAVLGMQAFLAALERGLCPTCEGILPNSEPPGPASPDPHSLYLALREKSNREHEARSAEWPDAAARDRALRAIDRHDDA